MPALARHARSVILAKVFSMAHSPLRVGLIGAGANTRLRHIPGLRALPEVTITAVCNRRPESTAAVAQEFDIPRQFQTWQQMLADPEIDAIVIGTWPYLHCPITLAALEAGKHVLTEARMALNAVEAHRMLAASRKHPKLVCQIVPSPFGLPGHQVMVELLASGFLGELREVQVVHCNSSLADPHSPLHWRQDASLSGFNMLTLGIHHETLMRWMPVPPTRVLAQAHAFISERLDPTSGMRRPVGTPDSVQVLVVFEGGVRGSYYFSGVTPYGQTQTITLLGSEGAIHYDLLRDQIRGASKKQHAAPCSLSDLPEIPIPADKRGGWQVEADFVQSIREGAPVRFTDFLSGIQYMEFTEAVARSAETARAVNLPLLSEIGEQDD